MKLRWLLLGVFVVPVLMFTVAWWWLLHTNGGARFLFAEAALELDVTLEAATISGDLGSGLVLEELRYRDEGTELRASRVQLAADLDVFPPSLRLFDASVDGLRVTLSNGPNGEDVEAAGDDGGTVEDVLESLPLPAWLFIDELTVTDAQVESGDAAQPFVVERLYVEGRWRESIHIDAFEITTPEVAAEADGRIDLWAPFRLAADVSLDARVPIVAPGDALSVAARVRGDLSRVAIDASGAAALEGWQPLDVEFDAAGTHAALDVARFSIRGEDLVASGRGAIELGDELRLSADAQLERANMQRFFADWPAAHPLRGRVALAYQPGLLRVADTALAIDGTDSRLDASADIDTAQGRLSADLDWTALTWPVAAADPDVSSSAGRIRLSGTPDDWSVDGRIHLATGEVGDGAFELSGSGDRQRGRFAIADGRVFGGRVAGDVALEWVDARAWSATVDVQDIDIGALSSDWPARITGHVDARGRAQDRWMSATLRGIRGTLRDRAFTADGGLTFDRGDFTARALTITHAGSRATIDGALSSRDGLRFEADIEDLGDFVDDAGGALAASGIVSLFDGAPYLQLNATSDLLRWGDLTASELEINDRNEARRGINVYVAAADVTLDGELITDPVLVLIADQSSQALSIDASYGDVALSISVDGAVDDWRAPRTFKGRLADLLIDIGEDTTVTLAEAVTFSASGERLDIERLCLSDTGGAAACANLDWRPGSRIEIAADISDFPVNVVNRFRDTGFSFDQRLDGKVAWQQLYGERASGNGDVTLSPGRIVGGERSSIVVATDTGRLSFDVKNGRLLSATLALPMPGTGNIDGRFALADVTDVANSDISGHLNFELDDIAVLSVLTTLVDDAGGQVAGDIAIAGSVSAPLLSGNIEITNGSVSYLPIGLTVSDVELKGTLSPEQQFDLTGRMRAGRGVAELRSRGDYAGSGPRQLTVEIRGENLTLIDVPDVQAVADVDVTLGVRADTLDIRGRVLIPRARVQPENLPSSRATVSEDVVIVAGSLPDEKPVESESAIRVIGELEVALGSDVLIELDVAEAAVSGTTRFTWSGDPVPLANGRYDLSGDIQAFGQVLEIVEGGVRYPNVSADNPQLRLRAEREIFGNSQIKAAGVLVEGTLTRPTIRAYTQPGTTEERALTLLVTGSDFNFEQGVGSVGFGTYVAPRLFVSYGVGLFDRDNVISARYDLTSGFGIKATSGQRDSGVDITYRFER